MPTQNGEAAFNAVVEASGLPAAQCVLTAGLDDGGKLIALHMRIAGQSILAAVAPERLKDGRDPGHAVNPQQIEAQIEVSFA